MAHNIFICYRREDCGPTAGRIHDHLAKHFRQGGEIFMDVSAIPYGERFIAVLKAALERTDVFLTLIGDKWLTLTDSSGNRRIDSPEDPVRIEIQTAIERGIPLIPILIDGAKLPKTNELPEAIAPLVEYQGLKLENDTFARDIDGLVGALKGRTGQTVKSNLKRKAWLAVAVLGAMLGALALLAIATYNPVTPIDDVIFHTDNTDGVQHGLPRAPATFSISRPYVVTYIWTYHCFNYQNPGVCGEAFAPGYISLKRDDGVEFGPWQVTAGNNVERTNWEVRPNVRIPSGKYTVTDSVPEHWSWNEKSEGRGFTKVKGKPAGWGIFGY